MKNKKKDELLKICEKFVIDLEIGCPESIYQSDRVIESAPEFIEKICDIVGYFKFEDDEDSK